MATPTPQQAANASISDSNKPRKSTGRQANLSLRGPTGPTTQQGKQKSRQNATKHGIFAVGILPKRESEAEYLNTVEDMVETLQPVGRLEEILVEKLAMLVWRYRRLLQAEAAEVANQTASCENKYAQKKVEGVGLAKNNEGLIFWAFEYRNEVALEAAILSLKGLRQQTSEKGLDWERDRQPLRKVYGPLGEPGAEELTTIELAAYSGKEGHVPLTTLASRYRELAGTGKDPQSGTDVPRDAAEPIVRMLTEDIERFELILRDWDQRGDDRNRLEETRRLVPWDDRLQRYEGSLERSFDRTLSQLERLQRLRLGQPVLPALKVDVSH